MRSRAAASIPFVIWLLLFLQHGQAQNLAVSKDGNCGNSSHQTCLGSTFGNCCSTNGFCGASATYCGAGCQTGFGECSNNSSSISSNGSCGAKDPDSQTCPGSVWGPCCSQNGFCGDTDVYCGTGCQSDFGTCGSANGTSSNATSSQTTVPATSSQSSMSTSSSTTSSTQTTSAVASAGAVTASSVTSSTGFKAGMGVLGAVLGLAAIGLIFFLVVRHNRNKKQRVASDLDASPTKKADENPTWAAPVTPHGNTEHIDRKPLVVPELSAKDNVEKEYVPQQTHPVELPDQPHERRAAEMSGDLL